MNRKFTKLMAALALLLFIAPPLVGWGQSYEKTTSITTGDIVILVCETKTAEMGAVDSYGASVSYTGSPVGENPLTVEAGSSSGTYALKTSANKYLSWSSGNSLNLSDTKNANSSWNISFSNNNVIITNANTNTRKLVYNASSPRFACYTSSQTAIQMYKQVGPTTYTVTFDCDGGEGCPEDMTGIEPGENNFTVPNDTPTKEHYTFDEFYLGSDDEMYEPGETYTISSDLELTASWTINKYNVAMTSDGTDAELYAVYGDDMLAEGENAEINYGTELTLQADDVPTGNIVVWTITKTATQTNVTEAVLNGSTVTVPDYNITITGVVTPVTSYTITFVVPTGAPAVESIVGYDGQTITLPTAQPSQACAEDWTFAGWATQSISETTTAPELLTGSYTIENNATLYAVYMQGGSSNCSVTFSQSGYSNQEVVTEAAIGTCATATFAQGSGNNAPAYYNTGAAIRLYAQNTMTITASNALSNIALTFGTGDGSNAITTNVGSYENGTWTGSASSVTFTIGGTTGHRRIAGIAVTTSGTATYNSNPVCQDQVATPTFSPAAGVYTEAQTVSIVCTTENATIYYTLDGTDPTTSSSVYSEALSISQTTTVKAMAVKSGMTDSEIVSAVYTIELPLSTMQAIFDRATAVGNTATDVNIALQNWVVSGVSTNGKNVFVTDGTKGFVIYDQDANMGFAVGNILSGTVSCKVQLYNGFAEITQLNTSTSGISVATGGTVTVADIEMANLAGVNTGALVHYNNLTCSVNTNNNNNTFYYLSDGTTTLQVYNTLYAFGSTLENGKTYNITGVYQQYNTSNNQTKEILPRSADDIEEVVVAQPYINILADPGEDPYVIERVYEPSGGWLRQIEFGNFSNTLGVGDFHILYCDENGSPIANIPDMLTEGVTVDYHNDEYRLLVAVNRNNTSTERSCYFKVYANEGETPVYSGLVTIHQAGKPVINANDIVLTHDATSGSIAYTISNPVENTNLTAALQEGVDWISDINVGETAVTFNTTANTGAIRTATITLTYVSNNKTTHATKVVTVTQIMPSVTGTISFGTGDGHVKIDGKSVSAKDNLDNTWTITTTFNGNNTSFSQNSNYSQVGSSNTPAETITFTTSLGAGTTIASIEAKFGGNNGTAGDINLFVDNTNVGSGALNATADVIVQSTTTQVGNTITVTVSNIDKGVKCYYISYSYVASTAPYITAEAALPLAYDATSGSIAYEIGNPVEGGVLTASINDGSTIADLAIGNITDEAVPFTCSANTATTEHTATITLTYKDANDQILATKEVTLTQDRVPMQNVTMAFHPTAAMATIGIEEFTVPTLTINPAGLTVTYSSSNTTVATVDETTGEVTIGTSAGITEITATFAGNDAYYPASALYTLFVNADPNVPILTVDEEYITPTTAPVLWTPCASVTSYTLDLAPVAISESFEDNAIPDDWTNNGVIISSGKDGDGTYCVGFNGKNDNLITPALSNPKAISFMYKRSSNTAAWTLDVSVANSVEGPWSSIGSVSDAETTWKTFTGTISLTGTVYVKFTDNRDSGASERYIDLIQVAGGYNSQNVTGTSYTFANLSAGATYFARVKGETDYSNVVSFTTLPFTLDIAGYGNSTKDGYYLIASPVGVVTPTAANGILTSEYDLYIFDESQNGAEWRNYEVMTEGDNPQHANFSTLEPGKGYLYASQTNTTLKFTGTPYDGEGTFTLSKTGNVQLSGWNLVGNPYATIASIDKTDFYVMNEAGNEIVTSENNTIAAMQGVFVHAGEDCETVTFTPGNTDAVNQSITAQVSQNRGSVIDRVRVRFGEGRQLPKFMLNSDNTKLYIPQGNNDYAVVRSANEGEMPVNFKASKNGTYTISVNAENVEMTYLHLIDNMTGADIDLLATPSYSFEAKTTDYASRFRLVFNANNGSNENGNETFAYYNGSEWMINNMGDATLQVIDVMGRVLSTETVSGNATINLNQTPGVYMFRLVNGDSVKVQKVVVR